MMVEFTKCHGSGNDFVLVDEMQKTVVPEQDRGKIAQLLCDREGPIGADGILYCLPSPLHDVQMRMFNPDGSEAQMCANGIRCVARQALDTLGRPTIQIETLNGFATAETAPELSNGVYTVSVTVGPVSKTPQDLPLEITAPSCIDRPIEELGRPYRFTALSVGNPHLIRKVDVIDDRELVDLGQHVESGLDILPERANVSFFQEVGPQEIFVSTFERGAGLTHSCGSAMAASSVTACLLNLCSFGIEQKVFNKGGYIWCRPFYSEDSNIHVGMNGNATFLYSGSIDVSPERGSVGAPTITQTYTYEIDAYARIADEAQKVIADNGMNLNT